MRCQQMHKHATVYLHHVVWLKGTCLKLPLRFPTHLPAN